MVSCKDITELLTEYLEGEMSFGERMQIRAHLMMCCACQRYVEQLKLCVDSCGHLPPPEVDEELQEALMTTFRDWTVREGDVPP